jgi:hypothetical protein
MNTTTATLDELSTRYDSRLNRWNEANREGLNFRDWIHRLFGNEEFNRMLRRYSAVSDAPFRGAKVADYEPIMMEQMQIGGIAACLGFDYMIEVSAGVGMPSITTKMYDGGMHVKVVEPDEDLNEARSHITRELHTKNDFDITDTFEDLQRKFQPTKFSRGIVVAAYPHLEDETKLFDFVTTYDTSFVYLPCDCDGQRAAKMNLAVSHLEQHHHNPIILVDQTEYEFRKIGVVSLK